MKLNDLDLNKLVVFMAVAQAGGITKAAGPLGLTPSAVSQSVRALETWLGVNLFDRVGKRFVLSPQGVVLEQHLERYQQGLLEGLRKVQSPSTPVQGQLQLGVFYGFSNALLAQFLATLRRDYPAIAVNVVFGAPSELDRLLSYGRLDLTINLFAAAADLALRETLLGADELWLVSAQKPPRRALDFKEFRKAPFIDYYRKSRLMSAWAAHHFGRRVRDLPVVMYASHSELVVQLILGGVGIGIVASSIARPYVQASKLFVIRGKSKQLVSPIYLKERRTRAVAVAQAIFKERALNYFGEALR